MLAALQRRDEDIAPYPCAGCVPYGWCRSQGLLCKITLVLACWIAARVAPGGDVPIGLPENYKLLYAQDFSQPKAFNDFVMADPKAWKISATNGTPALELWTQSHYNPTVRSPFNLAVIGDRVFGDFILEAEMVSTVAEMPNRDMCISFGMQSATKFYYAHLASHADGKTHHNIFVVNDQPRTNIARPTTNGVKWGSTTDVHKVRVERLVASGLVKVFFDDFTKPVLNAEDKTFTSGYIGFGSFDDTGKIANIKIWGPSVEMKPAGFYERPGKGN